MTEAQRDQIRNLCRDGMGYKSIAGLLELPESTVKSYCRRHGVVRRNIAKQIVNMDTCRECGARLYNTKGHRQRVFCSAECRKTYWQKHISERKNTVESVCQFCGKRITDYAIRKRKYCSLECSHKARRKA